MIPDGGRTVLYWFLFTIVTLIGIGFILFLNFFVLFGKDTLDAVEYAAKRMKQEGIDVEGDHFARIITLIKNEMKPGTDFHKKSKGEKDYYKEVERFLIKNDAFDEPEKSI